MSETMTAVVKQWTAKRKSVRVVEIIQSKTTVAEARRTFDRNTRMSLQTFRKHMKRRCWSLERENARPHQALAMRIPNKAFKLAA